MWFRDGLKGHQRVWVYKTPEPNSNGWAIGRPTQAAAKGPETGDAGRSAADAAALTAGYALLDEAGAVTLPELPTENAT